MSRLNTIADEARKCRICVDSPTGAPLPHAPNPIFQVSDRARLLIAGQAAGTRAHAASRPFEDPSGDRLRGWLGIGRAQFYDPAKLAILPMGFCFPGLDARGSDLPPRRECAPAWRSQLLAAMPCVALVIAIGQYAQAWHLGTARRKTLTETVAAWRQILDDDRQPAVLPLPHPSWRNNAWLKRHPWFERDLLPVLRQRVAELLGDGHKTQS